MDRDRPIGGRSTMQLRCNPRRNTRRDNSPPAESPKPKPPGKIKVTENQSKEQPDSGRKRQTGSKANQPEPDTKAEEPIVDFDGSENVDEHNTNSAGVFRVFIKHWGSVEKLYNALQSPERSIPLKILSAGEVKSISDWALSEGLGVMEWKKVWTIISHERTPLNEHQKEIYIAFLIPKEKLHKDCVQEVLRWLFKKSSMDSTNVVSKVIMMLYGLYIYGLVDTSLLSNPVTYNKLVMLCKKRVDILPCLTEFIRRITTAKLVTRMNIDVLYSIFEQQITIDETYFIAELIHLYQYLRPDLFSFDPSYLKWSKKGYKKERMLLPAELKMALYNAKKRLSRDDDDTNGAPENSSGTIQRHNLKQICVINQQFFEEFAPLTQVDVDAASLQRLSPMESMLVMLRKIETLPLLACNESLLDIFNVWAAIVFWHRFSCIKPEENEKHLFVLERCIRLTLFLNYPPPAAIDWLTTFLPSWDGSLFHDSIHEILRFMPLNIISGRCGEFLPKFISVFVNGSTLKRLFVWDALESMILKWPAMAVSNNLNCYIDLSDENTVGEAENFFLSIISLIRKFAAVKGYQSTLLLERICRTYTKILSVYNDDTIPVKPAVPVELAQMVILNDKIEVLESCTALYTAISSLPKDSKQAKDCFGFKQEMFLFYARKENSRPLIKLFKPEYEALSKKALLLKQGKKERGLLNVELMTEKLNCFYSKALHEYCVDPSSPCPINYGQNHFRWNDLKLKAPQVYRHLAVHSGHLAVHLPVQ